MLAFASCGLAAAQSCPQPWTLGDSSTFISGTVSCSTSWDPDGAGSLPPVLVVGGVFSRIGDLFTTNVAAFDGTRFEPIGKGLDGGEVLDLEVIDGRLYAVGAFTKTGEGTPCRAIAVWNGDRWEEVGGGVTGTARAITKFRDSLVVGGSISKFGTDSIQGLAQWNGSGWQRVTSATAGSINALAVWGDRLYAAGSVITVGGGAASRVASTDGTTWSELGSGLSQTPTCLGVTDDGVYVGGSLAIAGGVPTNGVALWDGAKWIGFSSPGTLTITSIRGDGRTAYLTGRRDDATSSLPFVATTDGTTLTWLTDGLLTGAPQQLRPCTSTSRVGSSLYATGAPLPDGAAPAVARWDGTSWRALDSGTNGAIQSFIEYRDELYAIGGFTRFNGAQINKIATWNGSAWRAMLPNMLGSATAAAVVGDDLWFRGDLRVSGPATSNMARWDGTTLSPVGTLSGFVTGIVSYQGTPIAYGFGLTNSVGKSGTAFEWTGSQWSPAALGGDNSINGLVPLGDDLIGYGSIAIAPAGTRVEFARWNGTKWSPFTSALFPNASRSIVVYRGELIVTDSNPNSPMRWTGTQWVLMGKVSTNANAKLFTAGGDLYLAGSLLVHRPTGSVRTALARWNDVTWVPVSTPFTSLFTCGALGSSPVFGGSLQTSSDDRAISYAFLAPAPCAADANCDGMLTMEDIDEFMTAFETGETAADRNQDGFLTFEDFDFFVDAYSQGC